MAYSTQRAVSDGSMVLLNISIDYFDRTEIAVLFDGIVDARQWAWVGTTDKQLSFTPAVANGVEVMVQRSTDISAPRHEFTKGAAFTAESLDEDLRQVLHIAQEATEGSLGGEFFTDIDMHGLQITNLGAATAPDHAVTLAQYQEDASGASAAKDTAVASASTAVAASNSASASASAALLSANNADVSEFNALSSANSASASASTASTKATEAAASAAAALVSENAAELAESNAKASEVAAAASAAAALHPWEAEAGGIHYDLGNVRIGSAGVASPTSVIQFTAGNNAIRYAWYQAGVAEMWIGQKANVGALCFGSGPGTTGELMRIDTSGNVGVGLVADNSLGALQVRRMASVVAPNTADISRIQAVASDYVSLPSYRNFGLQYNGQGVAGNIPYCPSIPAANTALLEAINTTALVIATNSAAPVSIATAGVERVRIGSDGSHSSVIPGGSTLYPEFKCRAWVNFNGTGTVAIRSSGNVSSITDNGIGNYTINLTEAMPDDKYSVVGSSNNSANNAYLYVVVLNGSIQQTTSSVGFFVKRGGDHVNSDNSVVNISVFR